MNSSGSGDDDDDDDDGDRGCGDEDDDDDDDAVDGTIYPTIHPFIESAKALSRQVRILEENEARMNENLFAIERELAQCSFTTGKYSDSSRINGTPQRFLTKFLAVRLKDLLEHETVSDV